MTERLLEVIIAQILCIRLLEYHLWSYNRRCREFDTLTRVHNPS